MKMEFWVWQYFFTILYLVFILLFVGDLLRQKKTPTATLAWFFFVLITSYIGLVFYLIFGNRKFRSVKPQILSKDIIPLSNLSHSIQTVLLANGSPAACYNQELKFLETGEEAYEKICSLIKEAKETIYLETYIFSNDEVGNSILNLLTESLGRGVKVKVLLDSLGAYLPGHPSFKKFEKAGGKVAFFMPLFHQPFKGRANLRNHRKLMVIDQTVAVVGGMNIAREYLGPKKDENRWVDLSFVLQGYIVEQLEELFLKDWMFAKHQKNIQLEKVSINYKEDHKHILQLVHGGPDNEADPIYELLLTAIYESRKRVWIATPYFVPDESLARALEMAAKRGVEVCLLIPKKSNHLMADLGRRTYLKQMEAAGVRVFQFPKMIHAKATLVDDDFGLIGSANMDTRSLLINYELGICLYSKQDIQMMEAWFKHKLEVCFEGLPELRRRDEWIGGLARLLGPLI